MRDEGNIKPEDLDPIIKLGRERWTGLLEAIRGSVAELEQMLRDPWVNATVKAEGPERFKEQLADKLTVRLSQMDHDKLADACAQALVPLLMRLFRELANKKKEGGEDPCK